MAEVILRRRVRYMTMLARSLHSKHRLHNTQQSIQHGLTKTSQALDKRTPVYNLQLIDYSLAVYAIKLATHTERVYMPVGPGNRSRRCRFRCHSRELSDGEPPDSLAAG
jgi:hypothetical protein